MIRKVLAFSILVLTAATAVVAADTPNFDRIFRRIDDLGNFEDTDFAATITIVAQEPGEDKEVTKAQLYRRDREEKYAMIMLEPDVRRGQGYLQVGDNLWFYDPESREFSITSRKEVVADSDARVSDFEASSLAEDYKVDDYTSGTLGSYDVWVVELSGTNNRVTYPYLKLWIDKEQELTLKEEDYSLSERLLRTAYYPNYKKIGDEIIPTRVLVVDELTEGKRTQMTFTNVSTEALPDSVFTKSYLERVNR